LQFRPFDDEQVSIGHAAQAPGQPGKTDREWPATRDDAIGRCQHFDDGFFIERLRVVDSRFDGVEQSLQLMAKRVLGAALLEKWSGVTELSRTDRRLLGCRVDIELFHGNSLRAFARKRREMTPGW
jgi:hypothetical protein